MKRILPFLSIGYALYAAMILWFIARLLLSVYEAQSAGEMHLSSISWVPLALTTVFAVSFITIFLRLAYLVSSRRRRRAALILAAISCVGIPVGTILGGLTIYALTRPEISAEFR
jgi:zinc transporter ZupT